MKRNLFILYWSSPDKERNREVLSTISNNIKSGLFDTIHIFSEPDSVEDLSVEQENVQIIVAPRRTYQDVFDYSNTRFFSEENINILANSDIEFDSSIVLADQISTKDFLALTRYDTETNELEPSQYIPYSDSQDVWVWRGINRLKGCDFHLGVLGCDNKIAFFAFDGHYAVRNPSKSIKTHHKHLTKSRPGSSNNTSSETRVSMPYVYPKPTAIGDRYQLILDMSLNHAYQLVYE
jgi:hypothetical protein